MLKRVTLALAFVAALGVGGLGITSSASAYGGCHRGFHGPPPVYRSYGYGPRVYGRTYYPSYYRGYGYRGYGGYGGAYIPFGGRHHRGGVYFGIGF